MINKNEIFPVGKINKPHGIHGEMSFTFTTDVFDEEEADFFIFEMDGIPVPFFIENYRFRSDTTALLKLENINTEEQAREFNGLTIYLPNSYLNKMDSEEITLRHFIGFKLIDEQEGAIGLIKEIDESTENVLFIVDRQDDELLIPANDNFIVQIDMERKTIRMNLPKGLLEL